MIRYDMMPTDQGELLVAIDERGLVHVDFLAGLRPLPDMQDWQQDGEALAPSSPSFGTTSRAGCSASPCRSPQGHGVSASGVAGAVRHPLRGDPQLRRHRPRHRQAKRGAGGGCRERPQSALHHHPLPPGDRPEWQPHRLCGRPAHQAGTADAGEGLSLIRRQPGQGSLPLRQPAVKPQRLKEAVRRRETGPLQEAPGLSLVQGGEILPRRRTICSQAGSGKPARAACNPIALRSSGSVGAIRSASSRGAPGLSWR